MLITGWILIVLEIILLLVWMYDMFFSRQIDPAGKGIAMVFVLGLIAYIAGGAALMLMQKTWSMILTIIMGVVPIGIVIFGLVRHYKTKRRY